MYLGLFLVALVMRAGWGTFALMRADDPTQLSLPDEEQYWLVASSLAGGDGLRDELGFQATRMPLYPAVLAPFTRVAHGVVLAKVLHWLVGATVAVLAFALAAALFDRTIGMWAALAVAIDPFLIFTSSLLLTETFCAAALLALWWATVPLLNEPPTGRHAWSRWLGVGVLAAAAVYVRPSNLGLVVALVVFVGSARRWRGRMVVGAVAVGAVVTAALVPWAVRNHKVTGEWCWLTNRGGISLYDGVHPGADGSSDLGDIKQMPAVAGLKEGEWNRYFFRESLRLIREDPGRVVGLAGVKLRRMWNPFPNVETHQSSSVRLVSAGWVLPVYALGACGVFLLLKRHGVGEVRAALFLLLPAVCLTMLHSLFVGSVRYRLVAMPMLEILAAVALVQLCRRVRGRSSIGGSAVA